MKLEIYLTQNVICFDMDNLIAFLFGFRKNKIYSENISNSIVVVFV